MTFTSGRIATINGSPGELEGFSYTFEERGEDLEAYIDVDQDLLDINNDVIARKGVAARQKIEETDDVDLQGDSIDIGTTQEIKWMWTNYWIVPGEFVVVGNSEGEFAFDLIEQAIGTTVDKTRFDLGSLIDDFPGQWMGSFEDRPDNVQRGTLYGDRIEDDTDMGQAFLESDKPQVGPWINYEGQELKVRVGRDGWAQVVSPGTYNREKYLGLVRDVLLNYSV